MSAPLLQRLLRRRLPFIVAINAAIVVLAFYLAFAVHVEYMTAPATMAVLRRMLPAVLLIKLLVFWRYGLFRGWWRYVSMEDVIAIFKANVVASAVVIAYAVFVHRLDHIPRSTLLLDGLFCFTFIAGIRFAVRAWREHFLPMGDGAGQTRVLIAGAGDAGLMIARELRMNRKLNYLAVGFVDDDKRKRHATLHGLPVLGRCKDIAAICAREQVDEVVIAIPSATGRQVSRIVQFCRAAGVRYKTLPSVGGLLDGSVSVQQLKDVSLEDLLGREQVHLDDEIISACLRDKRVLVTGAGGSIGSELCRQIVNFAPAQLVMFDNGETALFNIDKELRALAPRLEVVAVVGDIRYRARVEAIFAEYRPQVVFHAAAYKHVPLMELNPAEAVNNNVRGTMVMAQTANNHAVERFVMISTDKAVNPTNVMGASKRAAEKFVQALAATSVTRFVTVRFGNVLGSNGSVIPTFTEQIKAGGPVTVTHKEITRFFMTIPEAAQLVLQAGSMGAGGEIFLLDMGEPVKILDLAKELIRLSGKEPYRDIDIEFTGLRPGEKLYEELLLAGEGVKPTAHEKICVAAAVHEDAATLEEQLEQLFAAARRLDLVAVLDWLQRIVPEYCPARHCSARTLNGGGHSTDNEVTDNHD